MFFHIIIEPLKLLKALLKNQTLRILKEILGFYVFCPLVVTNVFRWLHVNNDRVRDVLCAFVRLVLDLNHF